MKKEDKEALQSLLMGIGMMIVFAWITGTITYWIMSYDSMCALSDRDLSLVEVLGRQIEFIKELRIF